MQATTIERLIVLHFRSRPGRVLALIGLALVLAASAVVPPLIVAHVVDRAIGGTIDATAAAIAAAGIAALAAWDGLLTLVRRRLAAANQIAARAETARDHFRFCVHLPMSEFREGNHAALIRSFDDLDTIVEVLARISAEFFANATIVVSYAALMLFVEVRLSLGLFALAGLGLATSVILAHATRRACEVWLPRRDSRFAYIVECLTSMLTIKTMSAHAEVARPFLIEQSAEDASLLTYQNRVATADAASRFWSVATPGVVAATGAVMLIQGQITAGTLVLFLSVSAGLIAALTALHFELQQFQQAAAALARLRTVTGGRPETLEDDAQRNVPTQIQGGIATTDLCFRHDGSAFATLDHLTLRIDAKEHVAIVAPSGAGKTTLAYLLARLYDPATGSIALGGTPAGAVPLGYYRRQVLLVSHAVEVFSASVRDNVRLWNESVSDAQVRAALDAAGLAETVGRFDEGLDAMLGPRGNPLSAGQRQRLGLARVFLRSPEVLILDEATSALDVESERLVLQNIRRLMRDGILVVITHRDRIAASLDRVIRVREGAVVET